MKVAFAIHGGAHTQGMYRAPIDGSGKLYVGIYAE